MTFVTQEGERVTVHAAKGTTLLQVAIDNDLDVEGACEGTLACSTCHMVLESNVYQQLPKPKDEELDMLDLAVGLTDTSRLGCQIIVGEHLTNAEIKLPPETVSQL
jgi:ferredoxin